MKIPKVNLQIWLKNNINCTNSTVCKFRPLIDSMQTTGATSSTIQKRKDAKIVTEK